MSHRPQGAPHASQTEMIQGGEAFVSHEAPRTIRTGGAGEGLGDPSAPTEAEPSAPATLDEAAFALMNV